MIGSIQHGPGNVCAAVKSLLAKQTIELTLYLRMAAGKREPDPAEPVEHHDPHPVLATQNTQSLSRRVSNSLDVRPHACAHIQKKEDVDRHFFARDAAHRQGPA